MTEQTVANIYCSNEWASPPSHWIGDPEEYRPLVEEALKAFDASSSLDFVGYLYPNWVGTLVDEVCSPSSTDGLLVVGDRTYGESKEPWGLCRMSVYRPKHGKVAVNLTWVYKYSNDECWVDLYLDVPTEQPDTVAVPREQLEGEE